MSSKQRVSTTPRSNSLDGIAENLQQLRAQAGDPSYAEIALRIAALREERGMSSSAARVARSTVFDAFRTGRSRINPSLVADIVLALGQDPEAAETWRQRCAHASKLPEGDSTGSQYDAKEVSAKQPSGLSHPTPTGTEHRNTSILIVLVACVGLNIFGNTVTMKYGLPVFLDMIGTATAAIVLGPWFGAAVAIATGVATSLSGAPVSLVFSLVGVAGALAWGYGFHRFGMGRTPLRFLLLNLVTAVLCTLVAVPITVFVFGGTVTHASNSLTESIIALGESLWLAVFSANLLASLADKLISGYLALLVTRLIAPLRLGPHTDRSEEEA